MSIYTHTSTYKSMRIEVVAKQFERGLLCAGISQKRIDKILASIKEEKISAIRICAIDSDKKKVAEVEISINWRSFEFCELELCGFEFCKAEFAINENTGEVAEPKVYVNSIIELAKKNHFELSCWIRVSDKVRRSNRDYKQFLKFLGFRGGIDTWSSTKYEIGKNIYNLNNRSCWIRVSDKVRSSNQDYKQFLRTLRFNGGMEAWRSTPNEMSRETLLALKEIEVCFRCVSEASDTVTSKKVVIHPSLNKINISLVFNLFAAAMMILIILFSEFNIFNRPWIYFTVYIPIVSYVLHFFIVSLCVDNGCGKYTKYDKLLLAIIVITFIILIVDRYIYTDSLLLSKICLVISYFYVISPLIITSYRNIIFLRKNGILKKRLKTHKVLAVLLYSILCVLLVIGLIQELNIYNP